MMHTTKIAEMSLKDISYLELWQPLVRRNRTIRAILEEGILRNKSEFGPVVQEQMLFKIISYQELILSLGSPLVQWSRTICVIMVEVIIRNNSVKLF